MVGLVRENNTGFQSDLAIGMLARDFLHRFGTGPDEKPAFCTRLGIEDSVIHPEGIEDER